MTSTLSLLLITYLSLSPSAGGATSSTFSGGLSGDSLTESSRLSSLWADGGAAGEGSGRWRLVLVTDLDEASADPAGGGGGWGAYLVGGTLVQHGEEDYTVQWEAEDRIVHLHSRIGMGGRGMELSWLQYFNGVLYSGDDRSGVVYAIRQLADGTIRAIASYVLPDGDGTQEKGFKSEWAAVKDNQLYIGSFGKEWSNDKGERINDNPMWIKRISACGTVESINWEDRYQALRRATGTSWPGYLFHESGVWSDRLQRWFFLPRRASTERYNPDLDETKGTNLLISASDDFSDITVTKVDVQLDPNGVNTRGYSELKFIPGTDVLVALRSEEYQGKTRSWISVLSLTGKVLMADQPVGDYKFEGLEIFR
jgi:soluble calcium-activated nucleotidase 1